MIIRTQYLKSVKGKESRYYIEVIRILLILTTVIISNFTYGQSREDLEHERENIEEEIKLTNRLLEETKQSAETNLNQLVMLNNQVERRESLLNNINNRINIINRQIDDLSGEINVLNSDLEVLKDSYAEMMRHTYKNRHAYHRLMFLFSAKDFNQAYMRMKYLKQYSRDRKLQARKIEETARELDSQVTDLETTRQEQQALLAAHRQELENLNREKAEQTTTLESLREKEQELVTQLEQQQAQAEELSQEINRIIEEERRKAAERARADGREIPDDRFVLSPDEQIISENFHENKGTLPWPSERGIITRPFGEQPHPVMPGIRISNDGINIATAEGAKARAIFEGNVVRVFSVPGGNNAVIIRHGEYLTVYSNLAEVIVSNGQNVNIRQEIGVISTDPRDMNTEIHLQIWRGTEKLNPATWIAGR